MNFNHLLEAINTFNHGHLDINAGIFRAFLFGKKWYPVRAVVNHAFALSGDQEERNTDRALVSLVYLIPYTRIAEIEFGDAFPVELNEQGLLDEIRLLNTSLSRLLGQ